MSSSTDHSTSGVPDSGERAAAADRVRQWLRTHATEIQSGTNLTTAVMAVITTIAALLTLLLSRG